MWTALAMAVFGLILGSAPAVGYEPPVPIATEATRGNTSRAGPWDRQLDRAHSRVPRPQPGAVPIRRPLEGNRTASKEAASAGQS